MKFRILVDPEETRRYLVEVATAADSDKQSLGFLPRSAYDDFARSGRLLVAINLANDKYLGHLAFGGTFPQLRIFQTYVHPDARNLGVGKALIDHLMSIGEEKSYLSARADVAVDLTGSNFFYEKMGFQIAAVRSGGKKTKRELYLRTRNLPTISLLTLAAREPSRSSLPLVTPGSPNRLYLVDLNVIFDVSKKRSRSAEAGRLFAAGLDNSVRLAVSSELIAELRRASADHKGDQILNFCLNLPQLSTPTDAEKSALFGKLAAVVFPDRYNRRRLTEQDRSDIRHLITVINEDAAGFITSEKALLAAAATLQELYGIEILSPTLFGADYSSSIKQGGQWRQFGSTASLQPSELDAASLDKAKQFLGGLGLQPTEVSSVLFVGTNSRPRQRMIVQTDSAICALGSWDSPCAGSTSCRMSIFADEKHPVVDTAIAHMLHVASAHVSAGSPTTLIMASAASQPTVRRVAISMGFQEIASRNGAIELHKPCLGTIVHRKNWSDIVRTIHHRFGFKLEGGFPDYSEDSDGVRVIGKDQLVRRIPLQILETVLSPAQFLLAGRPTIVVPIVPRYAEELFEGSRQPSFLGGKEAALQAERMYISGSSKASNIPENAIGIFYESSGEGDGRKAAIASFRVVRSYRLRKSEAAKKISRQSVLDADSVFALGASKEVSVIEFDNLMHFEKPIPLSKLRELGVVDGANFVTVTDIDSSAGLKLVVEGEPNAR